MEHQPSYTFMSEISAPEKSRLLFLVQMSIIGLGLCALVFALHATKTITAPILLAIVVGAMFGPIADKIESYRIPSSVSAAIVVMGFIVLLVAASVAFSVPLSTWIDELPKMWAQIQTTLTNWQGAFDSIAALQSQLQSIAGGDASMRVAVEDASTVTSAAILAPTILAQIVLFLASFYFFVATRHDLRTSILKICFKRKTRWQVARVFRDIEQNVSTYLMTITAVNVGLGLCVSLALWLAGIPSPLLWGMMAGVLNYIVYLGPVIMAVILLGVGLAIGSSTLEILTPAAIFLAINFVEAQFVTPSVIGRSMTINPFLVFLSLVFWIWLWGPIGGFIAIPSLFILAAIHRQMFYIPAKHKREKVIAAAQ